VADLWIEARFGGERAGLMIEVPVSPESGPYLVLGMKKWIWINNSFGGNIRSALRSGEPVEAEADLVREVVREGAAREWGNLFPYTPEGVTKAREYLAYYGLSDLELLVSKGSLFRGEERAWVPEGCAVLVPKDKAYLGMLGRFGSRWSVTMHNAPRGMAMLGAWEAPPSSVG